MPSEHEPLPERTMRDKAHRRLLLTGLLMGFAAFTACAGDGATDPNDNDPEPTDEQPIPPAGPHFSVVPFALEHIARITPVGSNNKVMPVAHTYWHSCDIEGTLRGPRPCHLEKQQILAPGDGVVKVIDPQPDGAISLEGPPGLIWTFGHVTPAGLQVGDSVVAGQHVATMFYEHGFDFGLMNFGIQNEFVDPERYPLPARHAQHPIAQFPEPLRSQLLSLVVTVDSDPYGRVSYDIAGTASGGWFIEGAPPGDVPLQVGNEHMTLYFGRYVETVATRIVVFGGPWPGMVNRRLALDSAAPGWANITPDSGRLALRLWNLGTDAQPNLDWPGGTILIEMPDDDRLRVEWFDTHEPVAEFTSAARMYTR